MKKGTKIPQDLQVWMEAREKFHLSHAQVQMARELGLNPKKMGGYASTRNQPWKRPLPDYIEELYYKRFHKAAPDRVVSIEQRAKEIEAKKAANREANRLKREAEQTAPDEAKGVP